MKHLTAILLLIGIITVVQPSAAQKLELSNIGGFFGALTKMIDNLSTPLELIAENCKTSKTTNFFPDLLKAGIKSEEFHDIFEKKVLTPVEKFKPEVILISAGFDAHKRDPLANINLESSDFFTITKKIIEIANIHSKGRVISFLEGGYDLQALSESIIEHLKGLKTHI